MPPKRGSLRYTRPRRLRRRRLDADLFRWSHQSQKAKGEESMRHRKLGLLLGLALIGVVAVATASAASSGSTDPNEVKPVGPEGAAIDRQIPGNQSPAHLPTTAAPRPAPLAIAGPGAELGTHFAGLT